MAAAISLARSVEVGAASTLRYRIKPTTIILHPLARGPELSSDLDDTAHNWYFAQARGAVFVRMALLVTIFKIFI